MKKLLGMILFTFCGFAMANINVVMVTPRGETQMEVIFRDELQRLLPSRKLNFTLIQPNVNNAQEMKDLPKLVKQKMPDLIYSWGTPTTLALAGTYDKPIIDDIPIVFTVVAYPTRQNLVKQIDTPARNLTGVQHLPPVKDQIFQMQEYKKFKTVGIVFNPNEPNAVFAVDELKTISGFKVIAIPVDTDKIDGHLIAKQIPQKVRELKKLGAEWLYLGPDTFVSFSQRKLITFSAIEADLPQFTANESAIRDGNALYGLFSPVDNLAKFTAHKAYEVLSGKKNIRSLPIETLNKFTHVVNLCTANSLRLYPPMYVFRSADIIFPEQEGVIGCKVFN